jgi:hypothetical protein
MLAIRNMITFWDFIIRLNKTPGAFRVTHPHQFTILDLILVLLQLWFFGARGTSSAANRYWLKIPFRHLAPVLLREQQPRLRHSRALRPPARPRNAAYLFGFLQADRGHNRADRQVRGPS